MNKDESNVSSSQMPSFGEKSKVEDLSGVSFQTANVLSGSDSQATGEDAQIVE